MIHIIWFQIFVLYVDQNSHLKADVAVKVALPFK